jgi:hypothetical protein
MPSLTFLLLLSFASLLFSAPVICGQTGVVTVLDSDIVIGNGGEPKNYKCNPNHTCRYDCNCNSGTTEKIYIDLRPWSPFLNSANQEKWKQGCDHMSVEQYVDVEIKQKYPGVNFAGVDNIFQAVIMKYKDLCSGGNLPTQASLEEIKAKATQQFSAPYRSKISTANLQIVSKAASIVSSFMEQVMNHKFEHCPCAPFFTSAGYKSTDAFWMNIENKCKNKCPSTVQFSNYKLGSTISLEYE